MAADSPLGVFVGFVEALILEPSSVFALLIPLVSLTASPDSNMFAETEIDPIAFGRVVEVIKTRGRVDQLHANRLRLNDDVSVGGVFNLFDLREKQSYALNIRVTF